MKMINKSSLILALSSAVALGQIDGGPNVPAGGETPPVPDVSLTEPPVNPDLSLAADDSVASANDPAVDTGLPAQDDTDGFFMQNAPLNEVFQFLAKRAGKQYFHSSDIAAQTVTGTLNENDDPLRQMQELAFQYRLELYTKGNTVYALTKERLDQLPSQEFFYQLRYLRPTDIEQIKLLVQPMLSPTGIVNYEPKTNTVIIYDNEKSIGRAESLLSKVDKPKGQIVVEVKILSVNSDVGEAKGVNWDSLGRNATAGQPTFSAGINLNSILGLGSDIDLSPFPVPGGSTANVVLSSDAISGVLQALNDSNLVKQHSNPVVVTEDNEQAIITIIDRVPIIEPTVNDSGDNNLRVTFEVRYQIDESDPVGDPATTREIGITLAITPTLLPDNTVRMKMRPRTAVITDPNTITIGGIRVDIPEVRESTVETTARIPDGSSLVVGGFYDYQDQKIRSKVPVVGDIPVLNFFFKNKVTGKQRSSLIFVVTPDSYDPAAGTSAVYAKYKNRADLKPRHDWIDPENPGPAHEPNLKRTLRGYCPNQAPLYQDPDFAPDSFWNRQ